MFHTIVLKKDIYKFLFFFMLAAAIGVAVFFMLRIDDKDSEVYSNLNTAVEGDYSAGNQEALSSRYTLIIDPGHGGEDGGATVPGYLESEINLQIAKKLEQMAGLWGVSTVMTRETDDIDYPESAKTTKQRKAYDQKQRIELINSISNGVLLSIHQNKYTSARPSGAQVLYAKTPGSQEFGELTHENLIRNLNPDSKREAAPISETIYLTKKANCPAILVECGFLSNKAEAALLASNEYQLKIASLLIGSYIQYENGLV